MNSIYGTMICHEVATGRLENIYTPVSFPTLPMTASEGAGTDQFAFFPHGYGAAESVMTLPRQNAFLSSVSASVRIMHDALQHAEIFRISTRDNAIGYLTMNTWKKTIMMREYVT